MVDSISNNSPAFRCAGCGALIDGISLGHTVGRTATCDACHADLHACRQCAHYDENAYNACKENQAERVIDKERSNFCDYFSLASATGAKNDTEREDALKKLDDIFK